VITLITGAPGAGKSAALVKLLSELAKGRPIFVDGIPELKVEHQPLTNPRQWMTEVPDGAAVVIDEVQRVWRPAGAGQRVPEDISALETHRHRGLDFFIVTQHPKLVHGNVRNLVGRHVHLRDIGVLGRWWYEWPEAVDPATWRSAPVKKRYRLSKAHLGLYRSATEHIKPMRTVPPVLYVLAAAVVGVGVLGWFTWRAVSSKMGGTPAVLAGPAGAASAAGGPNVGQVGAGVRAAAVGPRWPVYDGARPVKREPYHARAFTLEGSYTVGRQFFAVFGLVVDGKRVGTVTLAQLVAAGYSYTEHGPCSGVLRWGDLERSVTCQAAALPAPESSTRKVEAGQPGVEVSQAAL
jgi:zona occludens toxin